MPVAVLCLFFTSQNISTKQRTNAPKLFGDLFWTRRRPVGQRNTRGGARGGHNPPGRARRPRRAQGVMPPSVTSRNASSPYILPYILETLRESTKHNSSHRKF